MEVPGADQVMKMIGGQINQTWAVLDIFAVAEKDNDVNIISTDVLYQRLVHVDLLSDPVVYVKKDYFLHLIPN